MMRRQQGIVFPLILTGIGTVSVLITLYLLSFTGLLQTSFRDVQQEQARALAEGGIEYALSRLAQGQEQSEETLTLGPGRIEIHLRSYQGQYLVTALGKTGQAGSEVQYRLGVLAGRNGTISRWLE